MCKFHFRKYKLLIEWAKIVKLKSINKRKGDTHTSSQFMNHSEFISNSGTWSPTLGLFTE